jgi:phosphomannomutase
MEQSLTTRPLLFLFDVDGTLTDARKTIDPSMLQLLGELKRIVTIGFVGGSNLSKQQEQIGANVLELFDYGFSENGLVAYKGTTLINKGDLLSIITESELQDIIKTILNYICTLNIPCMRGTFIEYRTGMLNISPIGRQCSQEERDAFFEYDKEHDIRTIMVEYLKKTIGQKYNLEFAIGGQISIDIYPQGWNKTYCLQFIENDYFEDIHFFGDRTSPGGNDYELYKDDRVIGHSVNNWQETYEYCSTYIKLVKYNSMNNY